MTLAADDPRHGTVNGYRNYRCRCDRCRAAKSLATSDWLAKRTTALANNPRLAPHGNQNTYLTWGCRCRPCRIAAAVAQREQRARRQRGEARARTRPVNNDRRNAVIRDLRQSGMSVEAIAEHAGLSRAQVYRIVSSS